MNEQTIEDLIAAADAGDTLAVAALQAMLEQCLKEIAAD